MLSTRRTAARSTLHGTGDAVPSTPYQSYDAYRLESWRTRGVSRLVTAPSDEPVSIDTLRLHAGITAADAELLLPLRIKAARGFVENYTGRALWTQTWRDTFDQLPCGYAPLMLGRAPVIAITSITQYSPTDTATVLDPSNYRLDADSVPARVVVDDGVYWNPDPRRFGSLVVEYTAGYGTNPEAIPAELRHAVILLATQWSTYLEAASDIEVQEMPLGVRALLDPFMVVA